MRRTCTAMSRTQTGAPKPQNTVRRPHNLHPSCPDPCECFYTAGADGGGKECVGQVGVTHVGAGHLHGPSDARGPLLSPTLLGFPVPPMPSGCLLGVVRLDSRRWGPADRVHCLCELATLCIYMPCTDVAISVCRPVHPHNPARNPAFLGLPHI